MKQILIVEDDSFLNKMLAYNMTADGYGVTSALNARTAAAAIRQREFDLVLLDINLPDGNGFELCKLIKPQHPDTIVIFLTANDQESDQIRGYEVGAVDYITKPFVIGALQRKIKAMFAMLEHHKPAKDISYEALSITPEGSHIGVNANLSAICDAIEDGQSYSEVVARTADSIIAGIENTPEINVEDLTNYDEMKTKLAMEVVSADRNADMLQNIPHEQMEDMAVVYRLILGQDSEGRSSVLVTNDLMAQFGVTHEQLHEDAMVNAPEIRPSEIRGMSVVMTEMMGPGMIPEIDPADEQMFVAGVSDNIHGAGVIAYPNFFEDAAEKLGGDFYVLPSSIHEVLLVRDNGEMTAKDLEAMVREVNATQVAPEEQLTDHVYHYDSKS